MIKYREDHKPKVENLIIPIPRSDTTGFMKSGISMFDDINETMPRYADSSQTKGDNQSTNAHMDSHLEQVKHLNYEIEALNLENESLKNRLKMAQANPTSAMQSPTKTSLRRLPTDSSRRPRETSPECKKQKSSANNILTFNKLERAECTDMLT